MAKKRRQKSILNFLVLGLALVVFILLVLDVANDVLVEIESIQAGQRFSVSQGLDGEVEIDSPPTLVVPTPTWDPDQPTPQPYDPYYDTGE